MTRTHSHDRSESLFIATGNQHKRDEMVAILRDEGLSLGVQSWTDLDDPPEVKETGDTFFENAWLKAAAGARRSGRLTLADDSGLEVERLNGQPGIHSARYAGSQATDLENNRKLLQALKDAAPGERGARFRCVIVVIDPVRLADDRLDTFDKLPDRWALPPGVTVFEGTCQGEICTEPQGDQGFGYDPLFWLSDQGKTMAELTPAEKNRLSHRARALRSAVPFLRRYFTMK